MFINNEYKKYTYLLEIRNLILSGKSIYDIKLRVAYYSRVSTDSLEQATSIVNQNDYFINLIENAPNWTFVGGYTDEGISGKNVLKRDSFLQMIEDAKKLREKYNFKKIYVATEDAKIYGKFKKYATD